MMMCLTKVLSAALAITVLAGTAMAADTVASGKVKSINADNKTFVLTDSANKDFTFKLGDKLVVNRSGTEGKSDLKAGDAINVCYDSGILTWTAHYILVKDGTSKDSRLIRGNVKSYDADKKALTFTNEEKVDATYSMGKAPVRLNMEDSKIENVKIGDHALIIVSTVDGTSTLQSVMVDRAKASN
jgi:Cu/Ag efflux protein CusF